MNWCSHTWKDLPLQLDKVGQSAILPVGAVEQHGPQLGLGTDFWIADKLCKAVSENTGVPMLPTLPYGSSLGHSQKWPGTISIPPKVLIDVVYHVGEWAYASGVRRLFIINAHVTNSAPLRCALEMLRYEFSDLMVALVNSAEISDRVKEVFFGDADDWHANCAETALLMAHEPTWVRTEELPNADDPDRTKESVFAHPVNHTSSNGVTGCPSNATVTQGEELMKWMIQDLTEIIKRGINESIPCQ